MEKKKSRARTTAQKRMKKPKIAFIMLLIGGILVFLLSVMTLIGAAFGALIVPALSGAASLSGSLGFISGIFMMLSAVGIYTSAGPKIQQWSVVGLVFTIVSIANLGGFGIGFILGLIGSIMGLTYDS